MVFIGMKQIAYQLNLKLMQKLKNCKQKKLLNKKPKYLLNNQQWLNYLHLV